MPDPPGQMVRFAGVMEPDGVLVTLTTLSLDAFPLHPPLLKISTVYVPSSVAANVAAVAPLIATPFLYH